MTGCHERQRAAQGKQGVHRTRAAKASQPDMIVAADHDLPCLDVAVHQRPCVEVLHPPCHISSVRPLGSSVPSSIVLLIPDSKIANFAMTAA